MVRQCAWCLCLIDSNGGRLSPTPLPKLYEATHGMCGVCGALWIEPVLGAQSPQLAFLVENMGDQEEEKQTVEPDATKVQALRDLSLHQL